jgi:hypothetical protein
MSKKSEDYEKVNWDQIEAGPVRRTRFGYVSDMVCHRSALITKLPDWFQLIDSDEQPFPRPYEPKIMLLTGTPIDRRHTAKSMLKPLINKIFGDLCLPDSSNQLNPTPSGTLDLVPSVERGLDLPDILRNRRFSKPSDDNLKNSYRRTKSNFRPRKSSKRLRKTQYNSGR